MSILDQLAPKPANRLRFSPMRAIGERVQEVREELKLSRNQLAKKIKMSEGYISRLERKRAKPTDGKRQAGPWPATIQKLADALGVEQAWLSSETGPKYKQATKYGEIRSYREAETEALRQAAAIEMPRSAFHIARNMQVRRPRASYSPADVLAIARHCHLEATEEELAIAEAEMYAAEEQEENKVKSIPSRPPTKRKEPTVQSAKSVKA